MQLRLNLESKNGRRYTILKSKNWFFTFYIIKLTRITLPDLAVPKSLVPIVQALYVILVFCRRIAFYPHLHAVKKCAFNTI